MKVRAPYVTPSLEWLVASYVPHVVSALNVLTLSDPPLTEIVLNVGLAMTFVWAYLFHRKMFNEKLRK